MRRSCDLYVAQGPALGCEHQVGEDLALEGHAFVELLFGGGLHGVHALAADTDGIEAGGENAGAFADGDTVARLRARGLDGRLHLARNDSLSAFAAIGDLFVTGPTGTNVNDFRAILVDGAT